MAWTQEKKDLVVAQYKKIMAEQFDTDEQRAAASMEVVSQIAKEHDESVNGTRIILNKAEVYIKVAKATTATTKTEGGTKRVNKAEAHATLTQLITEHSGEAAVDATIIEKLTGKAALYFASVIQVLASESE